MTGSRPAAVGICAAAAIAAAVAVGAAASSQGPDGLPLARYEAGEAMPGGRATSRKAFDRNAFSHASANMPFEKELDFKIGNGFFKRVWVSAPASTRASDGLGPIYNARACQRCHIKDGRGHPPPPGKPDVAAVSMFLRLSVPPQTEAQRAARAAGRINVVPEPTYGNQLQDLSVAGVDAEGELRLSYGAREVALAGGETVTLRVPDYEIAELTYGPLHPETMTSPRVAPPMIGLGLLERIPAADITARADPGDADGDGISGRPNRVWNPATGERALGRFGWKAGTPSILVQTQSAFGGDIGISTPLFPDAYGDCTEAQTSCLAAPNGADPQYDGLEAHDEVVGLVDFYSHNLAVPARRDPKAPEVLAGKRLFHSVGCAACHTPRHETTASADMPWLGGQTIWPYTDLLLHDMGPGLADGRPEGEANGREWRTAPLWGVGLTETVNGHMQLLHDGRARGVLEAILWHGGEAEAARDAVKSMTETEREALIAFVKSL